MAYKIAKTNSFQRDLDAAVSYIVLSLENKTAAAALLDAIEECYDTLKHMPLMYEACRDSYLKEAGYRKAIVRNYIMIYKVDEAAESVYIMRLFHGRRDYEKLI